MAGRLVSVVIPTFHRPEGLAAAVASVLAQELPEGWSLEVVIGLSDPASAPDVAAAARLAGDGRVGSVAAARPGPAAARNAAMGAAGGEVLALLDDDCVAMPGWLKAGLAATADADLVQGRTRPAGLAGGWDHSITVNPPSWLWESCNLFVQRSAVVRWGGFDEDWNATGNPERHWGEDTVWGWHLVRSGARTGFAPDAIVEHEVRRQSFLDWARYNARIRYYPMMLRDVPEVRTRFYRGYFLNQHHVTVTLCVAMLGAAVAARGSGRRGLARTLSLGASAIYLRRPLLPALEVVAKYRLPQDAVEFGAAIVGSIRHRRILL